VINLWSTFSSEDTERNAKPIYLDEPSKRFVFDSFPRKPLQRNRKSPNGLYLANKDTALLIAGIVKKDLKPNMTVIEAKIYLSAIQRKKHLSIILFWKKFGDWRNLIRLILEPESKKLWSVLENWVEFYLM